MTSIQLLDKNSLFKNFLAILGATSDPEKPYRRLFSEIKGENILTFSGSGSGRISFMTQIIKRMFSEKDSRIMIFDPRAEYIRRFQDSGLLLSVIRLQDIGRRNGKAFKALREWVRSPRGALFISGDDIDSAMMTPEMTAFIENALRLVSLEIMFSLSNSTKTIFFLDDILSVPDPDSKIINSVNSLLSMGKDLGISVWLNMHYMCDAKEWRKEDGILIEMLNNCRGKMFFYTDCCELADNICSLMGCNAKDILDMPHEVVLLKIKEKFIRLVWR